MLKNKVSKKELRKNNIEELVSDVIYQFELKGRKFIVIHASKRNYIYFKKRLMRSYNKEMIFLESLVEFRPEIISDQYKNLKVVVYDQFKKTEPRLGLVYCINIDDALKLNKLHSVSFYQGN